MQDADGLQTECRGDAEPMIVVMAPPKVEGKSGAFNDSQGCPWDPPVANVGTAAALSSSQRPLGYGGSWGQF